MIRAESIPTSTGAETFPGSLALLITVLAGVYVIWLGTRRRRNVSVPVACAVALDLLVLVFLLSTSGVLATDEPIWHRAAIAMSEALAGSDDVDAFRSDKAGYPWLAGAVYFFLGPVPLVLIIINIFLHAYCVILTSQSAELLARVSSEARGAVAGKSAAWIVAIAPSIAFWTPQVMRETLCLFGLCLAVNGFVQSSLSGRTGPLFKVLVGLGLVTWVRASLGIGLVAGFALAFLYKSLARTGRSSFLGMGVAVVALVAGYAGAQRFGVLDRLETNDRAADLRYLSRTADSGFGDLSSGYGSSPWVDILVTNLPRAAVGPFPWELRGSAVMMLSFAEGTLWLVLAALSIFGLIRSRRSGPRLVYVCLLGLAMVAGAFVFVLSAGISNYGMLARIRPIGLAATIPIASHFLSDLVVRRSERRVVSGVSLREERSFSARTVPPELV